MLLGLVAVSLCDDTLLLSTEASGFTTVAIKPNTTLKIELARRTAVILDADPDSFSFTVFRGDVQLSDVGRPFSYASLLVQGDYLMLRSAIGGPITLSLWLLPPRTCGFASASLSAEHFLSFQAHMRSQPVPICLFSQTRFDSAVMSVRLNTQDPDTSLAVFGVDSAVAAISICLPGRLCKIESRSPFFVRLIGHPNRSLEIDTEYKVVNPQGSVAYCSLLGIPELAGETFRIVGEFFGGATLSCQSRAAHALAVLKWFAVAALVGLGLALVLQGLHVVNFVDLLFPNFERRRFDSLKQNPYASVIVRPTPPTDGV
jgi:hypothetical protein